MKKTIRIMAIVSAILNLVYWIIGRMLGPLVIAPLMVGGRGAMLFTESTLATFLIYQLIMGGITFLGYVMFAVLMFFQAEGKNEKIYPEIIGMIVLCAILPIINYAGSMILNIGTGRMQSAMFMSAISSYNSAIAFFGFISTASYLAIIMSFTMSICNKKFVLPLEYELGRGIETEQTQLYAAEYGQQYQEGQQYTGGQQYYKEGK